MLNDQCRALQARFDLKDDSAYILRGSIPHGCFVRAFLDRTEIPARVISKQFISLVSRSGAVDLEPNSISEVAVSLPKDLHRHHCFTVFVSDGSNSVRWYDEPVKDILKRQGGPYFCVDQVSYDTAEAVCRISGWTASAEKTEISVSAGRNSAAEIRRFSRPDIVNLYGESEADLDCGFEVEVRDCPQSAVEVTFSAGEKRKKERILLDSRRVRFSAYRKKAGRLLYRIRSEGVPVLAGKFLTRRKRAAENTADYSVWIRHHLPSAKDLKLQRQMDFSLCPRFSIVVPLYRTPRRYLDELIGSVQAQTYENWQLCLSDGSGADSPLRGYLEKLCRKDSRIKAVFHDQPLHISENTNAAIDASDGDFIVFADHDDVLTPDALFQCVLALNREPQLEFLYSDEDKISADSGCLFQPHFKPDFNIDLLRTTNYICHLCVVKKELLARAGSLRKEMDGAQDYDLVLRCVENTGRERIHHIPRILYHWRSHEGSTAENPDSKKYAFDAGRRAVQAHLERLGIQAAVADGKYPGMYRTKYALRKEPLISVIIPNKDHADDLKRCIDSIETLSAYRNLEYVIVENNSTEKGTFSFYDQLQKENSRVRVVYWKGIFNYSAINNFGVMHARGSYYLFLNNDTAIINPDCIEELLGFCMRNDVGAVGARLYYEDDTVQHAGVIVGLGGIAGHCFARQPREDAGYFSRILCAQDYSAVTAACMMVKKEAFDKVNGFNEELEVTFNDVDFCLKLNEAGYLVVYDPYAELYHYESKSRGAEDTPEKMERFRREIMTFEKRWSGILMQGDPYYNPNLTLERNDFSLRRIR